MDEAKLEFILKKIGEQDRLWSQILDSLIKTKEQELLELKKAKEIFAKHYGNDSDEEKKIADHDKNLQRAVSDQKDDTDINTQTTEKCKNNTETYEECIPKSMEFCTKTNISKQPEEQTNAMSGQKVDMDINTPTTDKSEINTDAYEKGIQEFMELYQKAEIEKRAHEKLRVSDEYAKKLTRLVYDGWETYDDKDKIILVISTGRVTYWAYGDEELGNYYFLIPTKQTKFNKSTVVQDAFLTFYNMPEEELSEDSKKPYVLRPAVAIRKGDTFSVYEKGQITFSKN